MRLRWWDRFRIRRCVMGGALSCGCSIGAYEMRNGDTVWVVDEQAVRCQSPGHVTNTVLEPQLRQEESAMIAAHSGQGDR